MGKKGKFRIGLAQMDSREDREANLEMARRLAGEAADRGADLVMFPETVDYIGADIPGHACGIGSGSGIIRFFQELAREYGVYLLNGSITERNPQGRPFNTSLLFDPAGQVIARYRKIHMFDVKIAQGPAYRESDGIQPGEEIVVARTGLADLGFAICYDLRFGEMFRLMARAGAQVILIPADFTRETGQAHWEPLLRARAIENQCYIAACGQAGEKAAFAAYGNSMVIDPWGRVLARAGEEPSVITADIDLSYGEHVQDQIPCLKNTREDIYDLACRRLKIYEE